MNSLRHGCGVTHPSEREALLAPSEGAVGEADRGSISGESLLISGRMRNMTVRVRGKDRLTRYQKAIIRACCVVYNDPWKIAVGLAELQFCRVQDAFELGCEEGWIPDRAAGEVRELIFGDGAEAVQAEVGRRREERELNTIEEDNNMYPKKWTDEMNKELLEMADKRFSYKDMAQRFCVTTTAIGNQLKKLRDQASFSKIAEKAAAEKADQAAADELSQASAGVKAAAAASTEAAAELSQASAGVKAAAAEVPEAAEVERTAAVVADAVNEALEDIGDSEIAKVVRGSSDALVLRIRKYLIRLLLEYLEKVIDGGASTDEVLRIVEEVGKNLEKI